MTWVAEAPANIALIKYMGKLKGAHKNIATNASLSYTLDHLRSKVVITPTDSETDIWQPLHEASWVDPQLSEDGQKRFLKHFQVLKEELNIEGNFCVQSGNNFPGDCGLASSASSFAALTLAAAEVGTQDLSRDQLSSLSRQGSGSSCRSFFAPWSIWAGGQASAIELGFDKLLHEVAIVSDRKKTVSSSEAHERVTTSALFDGRTQRAQMRLANLIETMSPETWAKTYEICWAEFWDMHALFETSLPSFGYMTGETVRALNVVRDFWADKVDGPIVTLDAGPNLHFLYRSDQRELASELREKIGDSVKWYSCPELGRENV